MKNRIYLSSPDMSNSGSELQYITDAFNANWITSQGENIDDFEEIVCNYVGVNYAVALSSGTSAIHLALKAAGVGEGDTVICQSLTFSASANPILYLGSTPIFVDSEPNSWNMDPNLLEKALSENPSVKAVIIVHLYGFPAQIDRIVAICKKFHVVLVEDSAESLGAKYHGQETGSFGDYGVFSFNGNKIITTSGGGMLVTDSKEKAEKVRFWSTQSRDKARHYQHSEIGFNYRMSNILAGIGKGQMTVLEERINKKKYINDFYKAELNSIQDIRFQPILDDSQPNFWLTALQLDGFSPDILIDELEKSNVESRPVWKPMHLQPFFEKYEFYGSDISSNLFENGVCLPSDTKMTDKELAYVCSLIKGLF